MQSHYSTVGRPGSWFVLAGILVTIRGVIELAEPVYWEPVSLLDYTAAVLTTVAWVVTGVAFFLWWQITPKRRTSPLLLVAAIGTAVSGAGNLLEDVFDIEFGEFLFTYGGMTGAIAMLGTAIAFLAVDGPLRWSGLFVLAFIAGSIFPDDGGQFLSGVSLIGLAFWLSRPRRYETNRPAAPPHHQIRHISVRYLNCVDRLLGRS